MDGAVLSFDVEAGHLAVAATKGRRWLERLVCAVGLITACMSVASAIYMVPAGVFVGHSWAYYASVLSAGVVGLAEACAAVVWLSGADDPPQGQRRLARRCVLCASFLPLAFMVGIGGARLLAK